MWYEPAVTNCRPIRALNLDYEHEFNSLQIEGHDKPTPARLRSSASRSLVASSIMAKTCASLQCSKQSRPLPRLQSDSGSVEFPKRMVTAPLFLGASVSGATKRRPSGNHQGTLDRILDIIEEEVHIIQFIEESVVVLKVEQPAVCLALQDASPQKRGDIGCKF